MPHSHAQFSLTFIDTYSYFYSWNICTYMQTIRKITLYLRDMLEKHISSELASDKTLNRMEKKASGMEALKVQYVMSRD